MGARVSQLPPKRGLPCAERVRRERLAGLLSPEDADIDLLHAVAREITERCGHTLFKAHRLAWGWTVPEAVDAFHTMCRRENIKPRGLVARSWLEWEAGGRPNWDYQDLLSRLFHANPVQLGWASDYSPAEDLLASHQPVVAAYSPPVPPTWGHAAIRSPAIQHLPPDIADFTGRHEQAELLTRLLTGSYSHAETAVTIATISGKPGVGKTALALHVAHRVSDRFADGQIYANLRGAEARPLSPTEVLAGLLRELGVDNSNVPEQLDDRARMYRAQVAGGRFLVLLDNAADEAQIRDLLPGNPRCAVLVTSRSRLTALAGAQPVPLDVMPPAQAHDMLAAIVGPERTDAEPDAYEAIASRCGFLPLAIRIAGAKLRSWPAGRAAWFADRLRDETRRLDLLKAGDLEVRASFALSYQGRREGAQRAFRLCALLPPDFPAWNLAVLLSENIDAAEALLEDLADAELVEVHGVDAAGLLRYRLHDLLRDFAREMLHGQDSDEARREVLIELLDEYIAAVQAASALLQPGLPASSSPPRLIAHLVDDDPQGWLSAERGSLVTLVQRAHAAGLWDRVWRLADALPAALSIRADWAAWEETQQLGLDAARHLADGRAEAVMLRNLGVLQRERGYYEMAASSLAQAGSLFQQADDHDGWARSRSDLGNTYRYQGKLTEAIAAFNDALAEFTESGDQRASASALNGMADALRGLSRWPEAEQKFADCLARYLELGDRLEYTRSTVRLAMVHRDRAQGEKAENLLKIALQVFRELGDRRWEARAQRQLGVVYRQAGRIDAALSLLSGALDIFNELADWRAVAVTRRNQGDTHRWNGDYGSAARDLEEALAIFVDVGDRRWAARARLSLAGVARAHRDWQQSEELVRETLETFRTVGDRAAQARSLRELGLLCRERGDWSDAQAALVASLARFGELGDGLWRARVLISLARLDEACGWDPAPRISDARQICRRAGITDPAKIELVLREW
jgi:tetratricopeptide (TPR) repeat protein